jgi:hypothetical protein
MSNKAKSVAADIAAYIAADLRPGGKKNIEEWEQYGIDVALATIKALKAKAKPKVKPKGKIKHYDVDLDMHGIDTFHVRAHNAPEARRIAIDRLRTKLNKYINHKNSYVEKVDNLYFKH